MARTTASSRVTRGGSRCNDERIEDDDALILIRTADLAETGVPHVDAAIADVKRLRTAAGRSWEPIEGLEGAVREAEQSGDDAQAATARAELEAARANHDDAVAALRAAEATLLARLRRR
jgi:hypothetical protein